MCNPGLDGDVIQDLLCTLPNLVDLTVHLIQDFDVLNDLRPWICLKLTRLVLGVDLSEGKESESQIIFMEK